MLNKKTIRKLLMTAVVMALATTPTDAEAQLFCWETPRHIGLFCNDGRLMEVCLHSDGTCTVDCGRGRVEASCGFPD